jgi:two-component system, OmpR family, phosphate regulon sensor histidine kinase PhoR
MPPADKHIFLLFSNQQVGKVLNRVLTLSGYKTTEVVDLKEISLLVKSSTPDLLILDDPKNAPESENDAPGLVTQLQKVIPVTPIVYISEKDDLPTFKSMVRAGAVDCIALPIRSQEFIQQIDRYLEQVQLRRDYVMLEDHRTTNSLQHRLDELETLAQLGRSIITSLDIDVIFSDIVQAAVALTGAQEGSLMLIDEESGELYMRAALNFNDQFVRTFRLKVDNSLAGQVVRSGEPLLLGNHSPQKIKTSYLVNNLIYVPLRLDGRVVGVLGVDSRSDQDPFSEQDCKLLETLAEYAVIGINHGDLYNNTLTQRDQLETTLANIQDGVIVVDQTRRLMLTNQAACRMFNLSNDCVNQSCEEVFSRVPELIKLFGQEKNINTGWLELSPNKETVYSVHMAPVPNVGQIITVHDVTHLKKMDRMKSEFVSTVSHDLRSPLTAVLGYVDLMERAGPLNDMQRDFIHRVKISVYNITSLMDDLLELGRIEGLDLLREWVDFNQLIEEMFKNYATQFDGKKLHAELRLEESLPDLPANDTFIHQMLDKLIENAIEFTPEGGAITISTETSGDQILLKISDTGIGIPPAEQAHVFERFYRGSNVDGDTVGTGLGLAIVRAIVDKHSGLAWVESEPGKGSTFFVSLPINEPEDQGNGQA